MRDKKQTNNKLIVIPYQLDRVLNLIKFLNNVKGDQRMLLASTARMQVSRIL